MYLTIYDLSGMQKYIFATNVLREIAGASKIIHDALFGNIPKLVKEKEIVYIGGGKAMICTDYIPDEITRELHRRVFEASGGALRLCSATVEVNSDNDSLASKQRELNLKIEKIKGTMPSVKTAQGFSINAHDNTTFEPLLLFGDKVSTKSSYLKEKAYNDISADEYKYINDFADFRSDAAGDRNYLAVIHIDGSTMGMKIQQFTEKLERKGLPFEEQLKKLGKLSKEINEAFSGILNKTVCAIFKDRKNESGKLPFRKVVCDGDDVTVICLASDAFKFTETFMEKLAEYEFKAFGGETITAGAGIAIVKFRFPFSAAYSIAEELCKNAKKKALALDYNEDKSRSCMDFHVCYGGATTDIKEFRRRNYLVDNYNLAMRPYIFGDEEEPFSYLKFKKALEKFRNGKPIAKSKLMGLQNAYGKGKAAVDQYCEMLKARHTGEDKKIAEQLADAFIEIESKDTDKSIEQYAKYFDALDVLDFVTSAGEEEGK